MITMLITMGGFAVTIFSFLLGIIGLGSSFPAIINMLFEFFTK